MATLLAAQRPWCVAILFALTVACSREAPVHPASTTPERHAPSIETPKELATTTGYHVSFGRGAELYVPPWFKPKGGGYDLIIHFHGESRWQAANIEHAKLNVAVVSFNQNGLGTAPYANAFKSPETFHRLLADAQTEMTKSGRADGAQLRRIALSAWSAGFSSIAKVMTDDVAARIDAILLADGFFTNFTDPKKRTVNTPSLEKFVRFAAAAKRNEKLFAITHTTIPTGPYPSVQECVTKLLEMLEIPKTPSSAIGPAKMQQFYAVDEGSLHIHGFEGTLAGDHVRQLHAMGETMYPYLKARWSDP